MVHEIKKDGNAVRFRLFLIINAFEIATMLKKCQIIIFGTTIELCKYGF